jgi:hypothetical protein
VLGFLADNRMLGSGFTKGMRESGYIEGQNVAIDYRFALGDYGSVPSDGHRAGAAQDRPYRGHRSRCCASREARNEDDPYRVRQRGSSGRGLGSQPCGNLTVSLMDAELMTKRFELRTCRNSIDSQKPLLGGACAMVHGQGTARLPWSNQSPATCHCGISAISASQFKQRTGYAWVLHPGCRCANSPVSSDLRRRPAGAHPIWQNRLRRSGRTNGPSGSSFPRGQRGRDPQSRTGS